MRRNSSDDSDRRYIDSLAATAAFTSSFSANSNTNVGDLICRFETRTDRRPDVNTMREILSSQMQPPLEMFYYNNKNPLLSADMKLNDMSYIRFLQQQQQQEKLRYQQRMNDSLLSLTDSEFCSDDQQQDYLSPLKRNRYDMRSENSVMNDLSRYNRIFEILSRLPVPRMSFTGMGFCFLVAVFIAPRACDEKLIFPAFRLIFGTLYPAYASYKAVRTKNVKEYVKWMMYWIVYAFFTCIETFTDIFLSWFPFYYEIKVLIVLWLLSPATKGSSTLYRKFVHPMLTRREPEIDEYINQAKEKGYTAVLQLGSKGVNYATNVIMQTALKGGGNLVQTIRRSYSLSDLSEPDDQRTQDEIDEVGRPNRILRQRNQTVRSSSGGRNVDMYFSEVDVGPKPPQPNFNYMRSSDDISSGYSSAEPVSTGLSRTASLTNATRPRFKAKRAEDHVYLESDEYTNLPEDLVLESLINNKLPDNVNSGKTTNNGTTNDKEDIQITNDEKEQKLPAEEMQPNEIASQTKTEISDTQDPTIITFDPQSRMMIDSQTKPFIRLPGNPIDKYELFYKWLEDYEKMKTDQQKNMDSKGEIKNEPPVPSNDEDDFRDPVDGSEDESFHDVQNTGTSYETVPDSVNEPVPDQNQNDPQSKLKLEKEDVVEIKHEKRKIETLLPSILEDFGSTPKCFSSDGKRPVTHQKGKAPEPPFSLLDLVRGEITPPVVERTTQNAQSEKDSEYTKCSIDLPETVMSLYSPKETTAVDNQQHSRSPSPRLDSKSKGGRMSLFKSYLPTFLRPESPKPNNVSSDAKDKDDDHPKETQI